MEEDHLRQWIESWLELLQKEVGFTKSRLKSAVEEVDVMFILCDGSKGYRSVRVHEMDPLHHPKWVLEVLHLGF